MAQEAITRIGFGQVEPNHLSAQRTGQIYAQLPAKSDIDILENGQFVKYDYSAGVCDFAGKGEWLMVFNEVKLYDDRWRESYKDFAMIKSNYTPSDYSPITAPGVAGDAQSVTHNGVNLAGQMVPRVIKINVGDIYTTNTLGGANTSGKATLDDEYKVTVQEGDVLKVNDNGYLEVGEDEDFQLEVVKVYNLADGQKAVKVMRIK
jgi:hypothetical protein